MKTTNRELPSIHSLTAGDSMQGPAHFLSKTDSFDDALAFFIDKNVTAAPVLGANGRAVGVLSVTDLLVHLRENRSVPNRLVTVESLMSPTLFTVTRSTSLTDVIHDMVRTNVHRIFVADDDIILGVISVCDILKHIN